jgi:hypothetical protein
MTNMQFILNFAPLGTTRAALNALAGTTLTTGQALNLPYWTDDLNQTNTNTGNILRSSGVRTVISELAYGASTSTSSGGPWTTTFSNPGGSATPTLYATFLTPGPDITMPSISCVPYTEFPRYFQSFTQTLEGTPAVSSQTISLTSIPDLLMVYIKPNSKGPTQLDTYVPISNIQVTFDNFSNLCSNFQQFHLYESAVAAGVDMDYSQWRGFTQAAVPSVAIKTYASTTTGYPLTFALQNATQTSGGPIVLRMAHDVTLQPGLAPGCLGNFSLQVRVTVDNTHKFFDYLSGFVLTIVAINTGFFETTRGQSMIRKTILDAADVAASTPDSGMAASHLMRLIGTGNKQHGRFSNMAHLGMAHLRRGMRHAKARSGGMEMDDGEEMMGSKRARASGL